MVFKWNLNSTPLCRGATTRYEYDDLGNQTLESSPDRGVIEYQYDAAGNVIHSRDARNITLTYQYDALNRLTQLRAPDEQQAFAYDACENGTGRLCTVTGKQTTTSYQYDSWGNITEHAQQIDQATYRIRYQYDTGNRITRMTHPDGGQVTHRYDALGQLQGIQYNGRTVIDDLSYRADGQLHKQRFGNGIEETRRYDDQGRLIEQRIKNGQDDTSKWYQYDKNSNPIEIGEQSYQYDPLNRLIKDGEYQYGYDPNGNRLKRLSRISQDEQGETQELGYYSHSNQLFDINGTPLVLALSILRPASNINHRPE